MAKTNDIDWLELINKLAAKQLLLTCVIGKIVDELRVDYGDKRTVRIINNVLTDMTYMQAINESRWTE